MNYFVELLHFHAPTALPKPCRPDAVLATRNDPQATVDSRIIADSCVVADDMGNCHHEGIEDDNQWLVARLAQVKTAASLT